MNVEFKIAATVLVSVVVVGVFGILYPLYGSGIEGSVLLEPRQRCVDTDNGINQWVVGTLSSKDLVGTDYCVIMNSAKNKEQRVETCTGDFCYQIEHFCTNNFQSGLWHLGNPLVGVNRAIRCPQTSSVCHQGRCVIPKTAYPQEKLWHPLPDGETPENVELGRFE